MEPACLRAIGVAPWKAMNKQLADSQLILVTAIRHSGQPRDQA
jgi:hypothetical protein